MPKNSLVLKWSQGRNNVR